MSEKICVHVTITGRVQGVFYRDNTQQEAQKRHITGWVRNTEDGGVEAVMCGERTAINELLTWCNQGPPAADVSEVISKEIPTETHDQFIIRFDA